MINAIVTKKRSGTYSSPDCVIAYLGNQIQRFKWDHKFSEEDNHYKAANSMQNILKTGFTKLVGGKFPEMKNNLPGYCWLQEK